MGSSQRRYRQAKDRRDEMTGDEIVQDVLAHVREMSHGDDDPFLRGYAIGQILVAVDFLGADSTKAEAAKTEIKRLTRPIRSEA